VRVNEHTALQYSPVWRCVNLIANTIAGLPWQVYRDREYASDSPLQRLLVDPNPEITGFTFRQVLLGHALVWGNAYAEIERDGANRPYWLWPIEPERVEVMRIDGRLAYRVRNEGGPDTFLDPANVLHVRGFSTGDGTVGVSPIRMAARTIGIGLVQEQFAGTFFGNGASISGTLKIPANLTSEQIIQTENDFNRKYSGAGANRVKVLANGMEYESKSMPMTDAQFLESRTFSVQEIARWYGIPPHKLAELTRSTNNNIEYQGREFVQDALMPWIRALEDEANKKLFGRASGRMHTQIDISGLQRADAAARAQYLRELVQLGIISINEAREMEGYDQIGLEGDQHIVQLNQTTLEKLLNGDAEPTPAAPPIEPTPQPENVIRREALDWWRTRNQA